MGKAN
jgi:signal-transduction protein with cAMP-binding, CBS, and nucleotidyltransferase domain